MPVSSEKERELLKKMSGLAVREEDIDEHFVRSQGAGGQKVNKTSSCVVIFHRPTRITVKCQIDRSQSVNRYLARKLLCEKIEKIRLGKKSESEQRAWKIRKQKKRRSRKAKEKVLELKRMTGEKKRSRSNFRFERDE